MKTYYKFEKSGSPLDVICSAGSNFKLFDFKEGDRPFGLCAICPALENIIIWSLSNHTVKLILYGEESLVTQIEIKPGKLAVGYANGRIKVYNTDSWDFIVFDGHTSAVTCMDFDADCSKLVSGSLDTSLIVWDLLSECGLYKLRGHTNNVTACRFMNSRPIIVSSSKDKSIKMWDYLTQHCFATLQDPDFEVTDFVIFGNEKMLISAYSGEDMKIWEFEDDRHMVKHKRTLNDLDSKLDILVKSKLVGRIYKKNLVGSRALKFDHSLQYLYCLNNNSTVEVFKYRNTTNSKDSKKNMDEDQPLDGFELLGEISLPKINYFEIYKSFKHQDVICFSHTNNSFTINSLLFTDASKLKIENISTIKNSGHRSAPSCVALNSNSLFFATGSSSEIKIWSVRDRCCAQTIFSEQCKSLLYAYGDRYLIGGMKSGTIYVFDTLNAQTIQVIDAHQAAVLSLAPMPNHKGFASCSSDQSVKFWKYHVKDSNFTVKLARQLDMDEPVTSISYSQDMKYIAVSAMSEVKLFYDDTLKYYLTLYGHKLPVNFIDISDDNEIIVTGSTDNNVKLWGLIYGDCRKSIHAHSSAVNCVKFVPQTHYFFSSSSDGSIKYWDADTFQCILELKGHSASISNLALNLDGDMLISVSKDYSIRIWEKAEDLIVPDSENLDIDINLPQASLVKDQDKEVQAHWKPTLSTTILTENLVDALDIMINEQNNPNDPPHPILAHLNMSSSDHVLHVLSSIPSNELDVTLLTLPYKYVLQLLSLFSSWMEFPSKFELCLRCCLFLVKLHFYQLINTPELEPLIRKIRIKSKTTIKTLKEINGTNMSALLYAKTKVEDQHGLNEITNIAAKSNRY